MKKIVRVGTRDSVLALAQTKIVTDAIVRCHPEIQIELVSMKTTGDKILDRTLDKVGGKGLFVKELDEALLSGAVDITVHSYKDMPMEINPKLPVVALSEREDPRDVLILREDGTFPSGPVGTASSRRQLQLKELYPDRETVPVRGNVQTRLRKLENGECSALVLAAAGIRRLGLDDRISRIFTADEIIPAAAQGIIAVQGRLGEDYSYLDGFGSQESIFTALAERSFVKELGGGCSAPTAAYAEFIDEDTILLRGMHVTKDGRPVKGTVSGNKMQAELLGKILAHELMKRAENLTETEKKEQLI